ncbi:MAG: DPP IV N-terminal domain-containing protein, partial [Balneolaceae bacterium]
MKPTIRTFLRSLFFVVLLAGLLGPIQLQAQEKERYEDLEDALSSASRLSGSSGPENVTWIDDGDRYSYMQYNSDTESMEIRAYNPETEEDELIFDNSGHTFPDSDEQFEYESFQWSADFKYLVFQSNFRPVYRYSGISDYYVYSLENESLELVVEDAYTAELSPDGSKIGYERDGNLFVFELDSEEETQLTDSGDDNFYNGRFGWVYEEEFGLVQAWKWSPDSEQIAFWQTDERDVPLFRSTDYEGQHPEYTEIPYPKVGDDNPQIKIGVADTETSELNWMDIDIGDGYVPRIYWTSRDNELAIIHLNRPQT